MDPLATNVNRGEASPSRLLLVDGHAYAYRSFHAIRSLSSPSGQPTNGIYGFIKAIGKLRNWLRPSHFAVVWDGGLAAERMAIHPVYKAQRPPMPESLEKQIDGMVAWLEASGLVSLCEDGVEADDWIATLARRTEALGVETVIASADKDFMQLVSQRIALVNPNDKAEVIWGAAQVRTKTGVDPEQVVDWLSLVGDSVDNIPGVRGVGPKTATELLRQFGSCAGLLARLDSVESDRLRTALQAASELLERNRQLIRLRDDLDLDYSLDRLVPTVPDHQRLRALYQEWGFRTMLSELPAEDPGQGELFK